MVSFTRISLLALLGVASFALPNPSKDHNEFLARKVCPSTLNANFDDLVPLTSLPTLTGNLDFVPTPYRGLSWNRGFRFAKQLKASETNTPPNFGFFSTVTEAIGPARISIVTPVKYFDLKSVFLSCVLDGGEGLIRPPVDCTFTVVGTKTNGETVNTKFEYKAGPITRFFLPSDFKNLESVVFERSNGLIGNLIRYATIDSVVYDAYRNC